MKWFENPKNYWGMWVNTTRWQKVFIAVSVIGLSCMMPLVNGLQAINQVNIVEQDIQQQNAQLTHQQRLLTTLKQKSQHHLTPEIARQLPKINQKIQEISEPLRIENTQWSFLAEPLITLEIYGHFTELCKFLTALLDETNLQVVQWDITQLDAEERNAMQSIHSQIILQLKKD